jgi:DNA polymerase-3 subunit gamma/tau
MKLICEAEAIRIDDDALATIAYRADGGLRDALTMLEQASAFSNSAITVETLNAAFGATGRAFAHKIMAALLAENAVDALQTLERASDAGIDMIGLLRNIIAEYRNLIVAKLSPKMLARDLSPADVERSIGLLASATPSKVNRALRFFNEAIGYSKSSGNPRIEMEMVILKLLTTKEDPSVEALVTRMAELENQLLKLA